MSVHLGIDVGTSAMKLSVVRDGGTVMARGSGSYATDFGPAGEAEQNPADWLGALRSALEECGTAIDQVEGIGVVGQTPTLVAVGGDGRAVRPAMTWQDSRAGDEAAELARLLGDPVPLLGTRLPWSPTQMPAKLLWLSRNEPRSVSATRWLLQPKDFIGLHLTGMSGSDGWSSKGVCEIASGSPAASVLEACGWSASAAPETRLPWAVRGTVEAAAARAFGLPAGIPVAVGWSDALAAMLAVGAFETPSAFILSGTSEIVGVSTVKAPPEVPGLYTVPATCAPLELVYGPTQASGAALDWIAEIIGKSPEQALVAISDGAGGYSRPPTFVPYIDGERAPVWRSDVRGVFMGLSSEHRATDLVRGVLLGVAMSARHLLTIASAAAGRPPGPVHVGGRGVGLDPWTAARLRGLGTPLLLHEERSLSALGAAMLGAAAAGRPLQTTSTLREEPVEINPSPEDVERADEEFAAYMSASAAAQNWRTA